MPQLILPFTARVPGDLNLELATFAYFALEMAPLAWQALTTRADAGEIASDDEPADPVVSQCEECGCDLTEDEERPGPDGNPRCEDCHDEHVTTCGRCDEPAMIADTRETQRDGRVCDSCRDSRYATCDHCDDIVRIDDTRSDDETTVCDHCYSGHYFTCGACDCIRHDDDYASDGRCQSCAEDEDDEDEDGPIRKYSDRIATGLKPIGVPVKWLGTGAPEWTGVELECEVKSGSGYGRAEKAQECLDALGEDFAVAKEDGSLDNGFELVTCRAGLDSHRARWARLLSPRPPEGLRSWNTTSCGMHVHYSREPLGFLATGKIVTFFGDSRNQSLIDSIAGRPSCYFAKRPIGVRPTIAACFNSHHEWDSASCCYRDSGRKQVHANTTAHYDAVSLTEHTIEFRVFKGTLKYESVIKNLEFVYSIVAYCRTHGIRSLTATDYLAWLDKRPRSDYPMLAEFLRRKGFLPARTVILPAGAATPARQTYSYANV
jgi:hypothetical protein